MVRSRADSRCFCRAPRTRRRRPAAQAVGECVDRILSRDERSAAWMNLSDREAAKHDRNQPCREASNMPAAQKALGAMDPKRRVEERDAENADGAPGQHLRPGMK